ncbi:MAG: hypothetical protein K6C08_16270 [Oscillospiraceae bacterium]|nr:hypothetical protein [Oscillospiraceae bacterium]
MRKRITSFLFLLLFFVPTVFSAYAEESVSENTDTAVIVEAENNSVYNTDGDIVSEESPLPEESEPDDISVDSYETVTDQDVMSLCEDCVDAAEALNEQILCPGSSSGKGVYEESVSFDEADDGEALLAGYVQQKLNQAKGFVQSTFYAGRKLVSEAPTQAAVYFILKDEITEIADGLRTSSVFSGPAEDFTETGLVEKTRFSASELGYTVISEWNKEEVFSALLEKLGLQKGTGITPALRALLADCPYELYWFNKTSSGGYKYSFNYDYDTDEAGNYYMEMTDYAIKLSVAVAYEEEPYVVKTAVADTVRFAIDNARQITEDAEDYSDLDKLDYYRQRICALTSYNYAAAHGGADYGDPWQIIYVFDDDPSTNVVCEGYAKAFAYLCELSRFSSQIECYTVTGYTSAFHMWNVLNINGSNVLVDVTNCDGVGIGAEKQLFLTGYDSGNAEEGYEIRCRNGTMRYVYSPDAFATFNIENLTLIPKGTEPWTNPKNGLTRDDDGVWRYYENGILVFRTGFVEYNGARFLVINGVLADECNGLTLYEENWYYLSAGRLRSDVTQLVEYNGAWFYVTEGVLDRTKEGLTGYDGGEFVVSEGQIHSELNGLWQAANAWYYIAEGQVQNQYTGLAQYDGAWFYVVSGRLAEKYTGTVFYDGHEFYVVNGQVVF